MIFSMKPDANGVGCRIFCKKLNAVFSGPVEIEAGRRRKGDPTPRTEAVSDPAECRSSLLESRRSDYRGKERDRCAKPERSPDPRATRHGPKSTRPEDRSDAGRPRRP